jgi:Kef-type K+ transport system membrane component KefB
LPWPVFVCSNQPVERRPPGSVDRLPVHDLNEGGVVDRLALQVLLAVGVIIAGGCAVAPLCSRLRQPAVVGQIFVGLAFGMLPKKVAGVVFPAGILPSLNAVAQIGLVLFLFTVGYELDFGLLRRHARTSLLTAAGAFLVPMVIGAGLASGLLGLHLAGTITQAHRPSFVLFMAVALSITAVPVLAWILRDRGLQATPAGVVALTAASIMDIAGWLVLAVAIALVSAAMHALVELAFLLPLYVAAMIWLVRPAIGRWLGSGRPAGTRAIVLTALVMASAWCTGQLGLHVIFGALLLGVLTPRQADGTADVDLLLWMRRASTVLLPVFFAVTGLSLNVGGLPTTDWAVLAVVCLLSVAGKVGGGTLAARAGRLPTRTALTVGVLLNTRGLTELIVLSAGWQIGLLDRNLYTILVLMAVLTTVLTGPLLSVLNAPTASGTPATEQFLADA